MICQLRLVLLDVSKRAVEALLFAGEQHETNRAPRLHSRTDNRIGGSEHAGRARAIVSTSFGEIPGVEVRANDENLLGIFAAADFADHVGAFHRTVRECVLNIKARTRFQPGVDVAFELALIFSGHRDDRNHEVRVESKNAGVRQIQPARF